MHATIKTLLVGSFLTLTTQLSNAEVFPPNFEMPAPIWGNEQALIAWGDCVPVPVSPMDIPPVNYPMGNMGFSQPIPMPQVIPYPVQNEPLVLLPPPSPFFNTAPPTQLQMPFPLIQPSCESEDKLQALQQKYDLASSASKQKITELSQALEDTQNRMVDSQKKISSGTNENIALKEKISQLEKQVDRFKTAKIEKDAEDEKEKYKIENLNKKLIDLEQANINLQTSLSSAETKTGSQARMITSLKQSDVELVTLKSAYKERNDENTALKALLEKLNNDNKSLQAKLASIEGEASNQARKLTALGQSDIELTALKSAYKERSDENIKLKESLAKFNDDNKTLKTQLAQAQSESANISGELNTLAQSMAELTTLKSAYKEQVNENTSLKQQLAELDKEKLSIQSLFDTKQTAVALKAAQDGEVIKGLKKKLKVAEDENISLKTQLDVANNSASEQTRKVTALTQSANELTALQSAYKERNDETIGLKKRLFDSENSNKTLQEKLATANENIGSQSKKLTTFEQSIVELDTLKSAYKTRNDENAALKLKLDKLSSAQESTNACKIALENLQDKFEKSEDTRKSLSGKVATLETTTSDQARKISALMVTTSELDALKSAYKDLSSKELELNSKLEAATADGDNDGVIDSKDKCPASPEDEAVNIEGCPDIADADKDGVADANDLCPTSEAGSVVNGFGCAPTENITLKGVNFATGSTQLTTSSLPIINAAAATIKQNPNLNIEIAGYTDNQGLAYINKRLSKRRANSVMIELIKQGVDANRLTANGYGEKSPVAENNTETGRASNRRVELKISN